MLIRLRIADLRRKKGLVEGRDITLQDIADETGLHYNTVQRWNTDKVTALDKSVLLTFAEYFGVSPGDLIEVVEDNDHPEIKTALAV